MATDNQSNVVAVKADGARVDAARPTTVQEPSIGTMPPSAPKPAPHDPYDPQRLRLTTNFGEALAVKQHLITVPMRKPDRHWWIRTHPDHDFEVFVLEDNGDIYVVAPKVAELCPEEVVAKRLYLAINATKTPFLWPVKLPGPDGQLDSWNQSAGQIADLAKHEWVRVMSNGDLGAYVAKSASNLTDEPAWPVETFDEILKIAFKDKVIASWDHPKLRQLRGEV